MRRQLLLAAFLLCVLTLTSFVALMPVHVNGASTDAKILSYSWYVAETSVLANSEGDLVVVGELQNVGTTNIQRVYARGTAYVDEVQITSVSAQAFVNYLEPGQKAPFYIDFNFVPQNILDDVITDFSWENVTDVVVTVGLIEGTDDNMYDGLTVSSEGYPSDWGASSEVYTVVGAVKNEGTETVGNVRVVTTFYNAEGTVVSLNYTEILSDSLTPGSSKNFVVTPVDIYSGVDDIVSYEIFVQCSIQNLVTNTPKPTSSAPLPSSTAAHPTFTPTDSGLSGLSKDIIILIVIVAVLAFAAGVLLARGRNKETVITEQN